MLHIDGICMEGFSEPASIAELRAARYGSIPVTPGVYLIIHAFADKPCILPVSTGGWFKGKEPAYPADIVNESWVEGAHVVYVGMAAGKKGLKGRLCQLFDFGSGKAVGHRGGRLLWHLQDSETLLVRWRTCAADEAYANETAAIACFKSVHGGRRPFANRNK